MLTDKESDDYIFNAYGKGGVGKTTLLKQYERIAKENDIATVWIDSEDSDLYEVLDVIAYIASQLSKKGSFFKDFNKRYKDYLQAKGELDVDPERPKDILGKAVTMSLGAAGSIGKEFIPFGSHLPTNSVAKLGG